MDRNEISADGKMTGKTDYYKYALKDNEKFEKNKYKDDIVSDINGSLNSLLLNMNSGSVLNERTSLKNIDNSIISFYSGRDPDAEDAGRNYEKLTTNKVPEIIINLKSCLEKQCLVRNEWEPVLARYFMMIRDYMNLLEKYIKK